MDSLIARVEGQCCLVQVSLAIETGHRHHVITVPALLVGSCSQSEVIIEPHLPVLSDIGMM